MISNQEEHWSQDSNPQAWTSNNWKLILDVDQLLKGDKPKAPAAMSLCAAPASPPAAPPTEPPIVEAAMICASQAIPLVRLMGLRVNGFQADPMDLDPTQEQELDKQDGDQAAKKRDAQDGDQAAQMESDAHDGDHEVAAQMERDAQDGDQVAHMERHAQDGGHEVAAQMERDAQDGDQVNDGITPTSATATPSGGEPLIEELNAQDGVEVARQVYLQAEWAEKVRDEDAPVAPVATVVTVEDATQLQSEDPGRRREMKSTTESTTTKVERVRSRSRERQITTTTTVKTTITEIIEDL